jgi:hypothetical protein
MDGEIHNVAGEGIIEAVGVRVAEGSGEGVAVEVAPICSG